MISDTSPLFLSAFDRVYEAVILRNVYIPL